eukprot:g9393.t1
MASLPTAAPATVQRKEEIDEDVYTQLLMQLAYHEDRGERPEAIRIEKRIRNCVVVPYVLPDLDSEESDHAGCIKLEAGHRRDASTVTAEEMQKIEEQARNFRDGVPPESRHDVEKMRRVAAGLPEAIKEQLASSVEAAWKRDEIPGKKVVGEETGKVVRIVLEQLMGVLRLLFNLPNPATPGLPVGAEHPELRRLIIEMMTDSGGGTIGTQRLVLQSVQAWSANCSYPTMTFANFCAEHMTQTLGNESSKPMRDLMIPVVKSAKASKPEEAVVGDLGDEAGGLGQNQGGKAKKPAKAGKPAAKAKGKKGARAKSSEAAGGSSSSGNNEPGVALPGASYIESANAVPHPRNACLVRVNADSVPADEAPKHSWADFDDAWYPGRPDDDEDEDEEGRGAGGQAAAAPAENEKGKGKGNPKAKPAPKKKGRARDYYSQYSFSMNRLINHQRRSLLMVLEKTITSSSDHVAYLRNEAEFEVMRLETAAILKRHDLWNEKKSGPLHFAVAEGKIVLLDLPKSEHCVSTKTIGNQLCHLIPATRPGSETRWWSIKENSALAVGFGLIRCFFSAIKLGGIHVGGGDYTPDSFGISPGTMGLTTAVDFSVLSHLTQIVGQPATAISAKTFSQARTEVRSVDVLKPSEFRAAQQKKKFMEVVRDSLAVLSREQFAKDCCAISGGSSEAVDFHSHLRLHALAGLLRTVGGYHWRFGEEEAHHEFLKWLVATTYVPAQDGEREALFEAVLFSDDLITKFRTKTIDLADVGTITQLRRIFKSFGVEVAMQMARAGCAYGELSDNHSIRVEFWHQVLQSAQQPAGAWRGDKAVNTMAAQSFARRVFSEDPETKATRLLEQQRATDLERLKHQDDALRFLSAADQHAKDPNRVSKKLLHFAYLRTRLGEDCNDADHTLGKHGCKQKAWQRGKNDVEISSGWLAEAAEISDQLAADRVGTMKDLGEQIQKAEENVERRKPAKLFWEGVVSQLPKLAATIPARRLRQFEKDLVFDAEKRGPGGPIMSLSCYASYESDLDVVAPTYLSACGRFVARIIKEEEKRKKPGALREPRLLGVEFNDKVYVVTWSIGKPAGWVALALPGGLGLNNIHDMVDPHKLDALYSFDPRMEPRKNWHFMWLAVKEPTSPCPDGTVFVEFEFQELASQEMHFQPEDHQALAAENGELLKQNKKAATGGEGDDSGDKNRPSRRVRLGETESTFILLQDMGKLCTARAYLEQKRLWKKRYALQKKLRKARTLTRKQLRDQKIAAGAKKKVARGQVFRDTLEDAVEAAIEDAVIEQLTALAYEVAAHEAGASSPRVVANRSGASADSSEDDDGGDSGSEAEVEDAGREVDLTGPIQVDPKSRIFAAPTSSIFGKGTPAQQGRASATTPPVEDIKYAAEVDYFSNSERRSLAGNAGQSATPAPKRAKQQPDDASKNENRKAKDKPPSPSKVLRETTGLYERYQDQVAKEKAEVEVSLGGFALVYRGSARLFHQGKGPGQQLQAKPISGTLEGDVILALHEKGMSAEISSQGATCLRQRDYRPGEQRAAEDYLRLTIAKWRFIAQRYCRQENMLPRKDFQFPRDKRRTYLRNRYARDIAPYVENAEASMTKAVPGDEASARRRKREQDQINEMKVLPESLLLVMSLLPCRQTN